tara:strand:+ start:3531 stop:3770 length:240 start_codon:yes stop_codon:yes gene_type:complete
MKEITIQYNDLVLVLVGEFYEGEERTHMYPGSETDFNIYKVFCGKQDVVDILEQNIIDELEIIAINQIQEEEEYHDSLI